ncbi:beta-glucosidase 24-like [Pyrus ussuriensis x Pyrus communis]|uniref:Beta-glucosidase 24-like n=1 Tax=Pyrus ussuriensis x Pyrus communis TaxID=2448454 RepID=A0A5N5FW54_9ROSA|nr:beta-glucosidase 24-like [Pyrus ussuriensis x Pyrus communis]
MRIPMIPMGSKSVYLKPVCNYFFFNKKIVVYYTDHHRPVKCGLLRRGSFDSLQPGFLFGAASSSYQVEGAWNQHGRGPSIWDNYTHQYPQRIVNRSNGDIAIDQYHRYKEDVDIMKNMGMDSYRFSISWSRLLPSNLCGGVNMEGIEYYNNLIDELLRNALVDEYGGFLSPRIVDHFKDYAELCFMHFGDRVKHWLTLNEPFTVSNQGYAIGTHAPGRCSAWQKLNCTGGNSAVEPYLVTHHQLLAHASTVKLYKTKYQACQNGAIGLAVVTHWFMDPITTGDYPKSMRTYVGARLPDFTKEQSDSLNGSYDFIGINYYSARYASNPLRNSSDPESYLNDPHAASDWLYIYPKGIHDLMLYTKRKYNDPAIYITENGVDVFTNSSLSLEQALNDPIRVNYYRDHLCHLQAAIRSGANFAWSILDNFEWAEGYRSRFGLNYVDYEGGLTRYPKRSANWFKTFLKKSQRNTKRIKISLDDKAENIMLVYQV